jgi:hypothetical protein
LRFFAVLGCVDDGFSLFRGILALPFFLGMALCHDNHNLEIQQALIFLDGEGWECSVGFTGCKISEVRVRRDPNWRWGIE